MSKSFISAVLAGNGRMTRRVSKLVLCVIAAGLLHFTGLWPAAAMDLSVTVTGVRSDKGHVLLALYDREDGFPDDEAAIVRLVLPARIGEVSDRFSGLEPGEYAIAVLHDQNDNRKLDFRFSYLARGTVSRTTSRRACGQRVFRKHASCSGRHLHRFQ